MPASRRQDQARRARRKNGETVTHTEDQMVNALRSLVVAALLASTGSAVAQDLKLEAHGFLTASMFVQDQAFAYGQGQGLLWRAPSPATRAGPSGASSLLGADLRQSRLSLALSGPEALGATPRAYVETDFGTGYQDWNIRIRQAFAELKWGDTVLQGGQYSAQLAFVMLNETVAHIANPITFGIGNIGARAMGFRALQTVSVGDAKLELAGEVVSARWTETSAGTSASTVPLGWTTGTPGLGARAKLTGTAGPVGYLAYAAGLYQSVNLKGLGDSVAASGVTLADGSVKKRVDTFGGNVGGRLDLAPVSLLVNVLAGEALGPFAGAVNQFGTIGEFGWWAQFGGNVTNELSVWALYGQGSFEEKQVLNWRNYPAAATATNYSVTGNELFGGMVRYRKKGLVTALEYTRYNTGYAVDPGGAPATYANYAAGTSRTKHVAGEQYIVTTGYFF
jgi:hypothetical protein